MESANAVFLVDDDKDLRRATAQTLELAGYVVTAFGRATEALAALPADFPGSIVSDIRMPEIDGLQFFDRIRQRDPDLPVILITGHGDIPMAVQAIQDGVYDFITKPFNPTVVRARVRTQLTLKAQADLLREHSSQIVARSEVRTGVAHAREQLLDRLERHPGGAEHFDPAHGFLVRRTVVAITRQGSLRRKQAFALVVTQHPDADPGPPGEFADLHLKTS